MRKSKEVTGVPDDGGHSQFGTCWSDFQWSGDLSWFRCSELLIWQYRVLAIDPACCVSIQLIHLKHAVRYYLLRTEQNI
jgi:hypothetical protein